MYNVRYGCACTYHTSDIYVAGGFTTYSSPQAVNTVEVYKVDTGVWKTFKESIKNNLHILCYRTTGTRNKL